MKKLLGAVALATLIASPALAATTHHTSRTSHAGMTEHYVAANPGQNSVRPDQVVFAGQIVGQDPDPVIRLELRKEAEQPGD